MEQLGYRKNWLLIVFVLVGLIYLAYKVQSVLNPLIFSLGIAYILNPAVEFFQRRGIPRLLAVILLFVVFLAVMIVVVYGVFSAASEAIRFTSWLAEKLPEAYSYVEKRLTPDYRQRIGRILEDIVGSITSHTGQIAQYSFNMLISIASSIVFVVNIAVLVPLYVFFFMWRYDRVVVFFKGIIPVRYRERTIKLLKRFDEILSAFFRGRLLVCLFVAITTGIGFALIGLPFSWVLGIYIGVLNILPYVPIFLGLPVVLLVAYLSYFDFAHPFYAFLIFSVIQFLDGFVLTPIIQSKSVGLHPITTVVVLLIGSELAGVFGLLLAIPVAAMIKVLLKEFLLKDVPLSMDTDSPPQCATANSQEGKDN